jgi:RNA methyltransferase, TrmH family
MEIGKHNRKLVELRKAIQQGTLTSEGLLVIEGPILLEEARRSRIEVVDIFLRAGTPAPAASSGQVHEVAADIFKTIHETEHSQGIVATVRPPQFILEELLRAAPALLVILCRLQDPGNVGAILRIGEAFDATGCIALHGTAAFHNGKVVRASAGSLFRLPHVEAADLRATMDALRSRNIRIAGTAPTSESHIEKWDWTVPTAILVGNEGQGLNGDELSYCDTVLRIPHKSTVESLNSAVATAVIMYEASKQRRSNNSDRSI